MYKNSLFHVLVIGFFASTSSAGDWSQWGHSTPLGNEIAYQHYNNIYRNIFICKESGKDQLHFLKKWYFYKGCVIGYLEQGQPNAFFIIDERSCALDMFKTKETFDIALEERNLKPLLWTRWYAANWGFYLRGSDSGLFFIFIILIRLWWLIPLLLLIFGVATWKYRRERLFWYLVLSIFIILCIPIFFDLFPQSI